MHFIDRDRRRVGIAAAALRRIQSASRPAHVEGPRHHRGRGGRAFGRARQRIGPLRQHLAGRRRRFRICSARPGAQPRHEQLPHPGAVAQPHGMAPPVPHVEVADHRDAAGIRRPHRKAHARHAVDLGDGGAEPFGQIPMRAFGKQMQVEIAQDRSEAVGIFGLLHRLGPVDRAGGRVRRATPARRTRPSSPTGVSWPSSVPPSRAITSTASARRAGRRARCGPLRRPAGRDRKMDRPAGPSAAQCNAAPASDRNGSASAQAPSGLRRLRYKALGPAARTRSAADRSSRAGWRPHRRFRRRPFRA